MHDPKKTNKITFPPCWDDDERMAVLFAPFRVRDVNPENFDSKMKFWQDMIYNYCIQTGTITFSKLSIQAAFERKSCIAHGLDTVIEELLRSKIIRLRTEYEYDPQNGWTSWALNGLVWRPLNRSVFKLKSIIGYPDEKSLTDNIEYVHLSVVKKCCNQLRSEVLQQQMGKVMEYTDFRDLVNTSGMELNNESLELCLRTLNCEPHLVLAYKKSPMNTEIDFIKIPANNDKNGTSITETDYAIHNLQIAQRNLSRLLEDLETRITSATEKARQYLSENKRQMAKSHLRKKHLLEKSYEKRAETLHNIEELLNSVNEARSHGEILDAYKSGSVALQNMLSKLNYDTVDDVIAEVRDVLSSQREIEDAMANVSMANTSLTSIENDELERELQDLVKCKSSEQKRPTNEVNKSVSAANPSLEVTVNDKELLSMLEQLEIEDESPKPDQNLTA